MLQRLAIMHIGWHDNDRMNLLRLAIDANMALHAKVPLIAFCRLRHLGIALTIAVFAGGRRRNHRRIDDGFSSNLHALLLKMTSDFLKQTTSQVNTDKSLAWKSTRTTLLRLPDQNKLNHCCNKYIRSMRSKPIGGWPLRTFG